MGETETAHQNGDTCRAIIEQSASRPDQLTIFASSDPDDTDVSEWVTATESSFVHLSLMR